MSRVAIVGGAGRVGVSFAFHLLSEDICKQIVLIDVAEDPVAGVMRTKIVARIAARAMQQPAIQRFAFRVVSQIGSDIERHCRVAIDAYAAYGERLRPPVEAMLYRIHTLGRGERSPTCEWPPQWTARSTTLRR